MEQTSRHPEKRRWERNTPVNRFNCGRRLRDQRSENEETVKERKVGQGPVKGEKRQKGKGTKCGAHFTYKLIPCINGHEDGDDGEERLFQFVCPAEVWSQPWDFKHRGMKIFGCQQRNQGALFSAFLWCVFPCFLWALRDAPEVMRQMPEEMRQRWCARSGFWCIFGGFPWFSWCSPFLLECSGDPVADCPALSFSSYVDIKNPNANRLSWVIN